MQYVFGKDFVNDLPITTISTDQVTFPIEGGAAPAPENAPVATPEWQRWNDYGIALLIEGDTGSEKGELAQAAHAFEQVERLGRADGPLNLARVFVKEGRLDDAAAALTRALQIHPPAPRWTVAWLNGLVNKQNGFLDQAITEFRSILEDRYPEIDRARLQFQQRLRGDQRTRPNAVRARQTRARRRESRRTRKFPAAGRRAVRKDAGPRFGERHRALQSRADLRAARRSKNAPTNIANCTSAIRPDDNARDRAIELARRRDPAADHAAQSIAIYSLHRAGRPGIARPTESPRQACSRAAGRENA